jgi:aspartyl-tRNA(Asn)/glutamyl-tRNA(Gln) amidotransferase subunit B
MEKNNKYQITIGLEIHTQVNTFNKVFSQSLNSSTSQSNTCVNEIDLGLPGTLPFFNLDVLKKAIILAKALKMDINNTLAFNRKVYFHYDLPKGYQITQFGENTIAKNGIINLKNKTIRIEEFHIEEDTAKQTKENELNFLDYNRCGVGLIEIVTKPDFYLKEEVIEFLKQLKRLLIYLNISDGKMEESNLRVDVNISISNTESLGTRVEIKNLNSFNSVSKAIEHEFNRQKKILESGKAVIQETRK